MLNEYIYACQKITYFKVASFRWCLKENQQVVSDYIESMSGKSGHTAGQWERFMYFNI